MKPDVGGRVSEMIVTLVADDGQLLADAPVTVRQSAHAFGFGCTGFEAIPLANGEVAGAEEAAATRLQEHWLDLFNVATLPFYWGGFEPVPGLPDTERLSRTAEWFVRRGVSVKGHPLCWHTNTAPWLLDLSIDEALTRQLARIRREVAGLAGTIDAWDVINEVVIMPVFDREENAITRIAQTIGRVEIVRETFAAARDANPGAKLLINDFDLSTAYENLIEECLLKGVAIDAIGIQSHMHQGYWGEDRTGRILERYARFEVPLHWTESTLVSGHLMPPEITDLNDYQVETWPSTEEGEARQADEVVRHYRTLFAHPAVEAITWWGLPDGGWLNAPSGLVRADGTPKPAFDALRWLIKGEWWMEPTGLVTDDQGSVSFQGLPGTYLVTAAAGSTSVTLPQSGSVRADLALHPA